RIWATRSLGRKSSDCVLQRLEAACGARWLHEWNSLSKSGTCEGIGPRLGTHSAGPISPCSRASALVDHRVAISFSVLLLSDLFYARLRGEDRTSRSKVSQNGERAR